MSVDEFFFVMRGHWRKREIIRLLSHFHKSNKNKKSVLHKCFLVKTFFFKVLFSDVICDNLKNMNTYPTQRGRSYHSATEATLMSLV